MINLVIKRPQKYVKCSACKRFDSISPLITTALCDKCHQPLKEISEEEYKQKLYMVQKYREQQRIMQQQSNISNNNNINNNNRPKNYQKNNNNGENYDSHRNNSSLHSSKIQFDERNNDNNNNININNNIDNNINNTNNNSNNSHRHHRHHGIKIIGIVGGGHHGINNILRIGRDHSSDRDENVHQRRHRNILIIRPSGHRHSNNPNNAQLNNNNNNNNINRININSNQNMNQNEIIMNNNHRNPFRIIVQRHHVPNDVFDPNFNLLGSTFDNVFQDNFSSNFRSNIRGNYANILLNILNFNSADIRRNKHHPISEQNIQKLKKFQLTEKYCQKEGNGKLEKPNCCICLEEIEMGKETILLPCGHMFHSDCCITWLKKSNTCPICRFEIK